MTSGAFEVIGGEFDGFTLGTPTDPHAERRACLEQVGVDDDFHDYMTRARCGLTVAPDSQNYDYNFWPIWPPEFDETRIHDPRLAEQAAHAMKEGWEKAMQYEGWAAANSDALMTDRGVWTIISDGPDNGLRIVPSSHGMPTPKTSFWPE